MNVNATMTSTQAANHLAVSTARLRRSVKRGEITAHRDGNGRLRFDPKELDSCLTRLSELPPDERAKVRPCDMRFRKSELDAWMTVTRLEFQSQTAQVFDAIRPLLPSEWPDARVAALAAKAVGRLMRMDTEGDLPGFLFEEN